MRLLVAQIVTQSQAQACVHGLEASILGGYGLRFVWDFRVQSLGYSPAAPFSLCMWILLLRFC